MFHRLDLAGGSSAFWEQVWTEGDFSESARYCDVDPLKPLFDRHVAPGSVMLEGGCGRGLYVAHHAARGVRAIGLDFALGTLVEVRRRYPGLLLGAADVAALPLRSGVVDTYYSGGVVEHFESGPAAAVAEARRVLRPGGTLLISVPYFSPLRRALVRIKGSEWRRAATHATEHPPPGTVFFQYAYTTREFSRLLESHGFRVVGTQGYSILWGLYELPVAGALLQRAAQRRTVPPEDELGPAGAGGGVATPASQSLLKRLLVSEDVSVPVLGPGVRALRWFGANMMMYECTTGP